MDRNKGIRLQSDGLLYFFLQGLIFIFVAQQHDVQRRIIVQVSDLAGDGQGQFLFGQLSIRRSDAIVMSAMSGIDDHGKDAGVGIGRDHIPVRCWT